MGNEYLVYIAGGGIEVGIASSQPNCPQLYPVVATTDPLALVFVSYADPFFSDFIFADNWGYIPIYPWAAGGVYDSIGIDLTTGLPIVGQGYVILTVFRVDI